MAEMASLLFGTCRNGVRLSPERTLDECPACRARIFRFEVEPHREMAVRRAPDRLPGCVHACDGRPHLAGEGPRLAVRIGHLVRSADRARAARDVLLRPRLAVDV